MFYEVWNRKEIDGIKPVNYFAINACNCLLLHSSCNQLWGKSDQISLLPRIADRSLHDTFLPLEEITHINYKTIILWSIFKELDVNQWVILKYFEAVHWENQTSVWRNITLIFTDALESWPMKTDFKHYFFTRSVWTQVKAKERKKQNIQWTETLDFIWSLRHFIFLEPIMSFQRTNIWQI